jgi:predicted CXXCH cytochrome family protein
MKMRQLSWLIIIGSAIVLLMPVFLANAVNSEEEDPGTAYMAQYTGADADQVGTDQCLMCHGSIFPENSHSHERLLDGNADGPLFGFGCEGCHGPGGNHNGDIHGILNPTKMAKEDVVELCYKCHSETDGVEQENWVTCTHAAAGGLSCLDCHQGHSENAKFLKTDNVVNLCTSCHDSIKAAFESGDHNSADPATMTCVMCHNPHI